MNHKFLQNLKTNIKTRCAIRIIAGCISLHVERFLVSCYWKRTKRVVGLVSFGFESSHSSIHFMHKSILLTF